MPDQNTADDDLDLDLEDDADDADDTDGDAGNDGADGKDGKDGKDSKDQGDKRIKDLQSARDKETARANKAEKALKEALERINGKTDDGAAKADPEAAALRAELKEASLDAVYGEFPDLKRLGIGRELVEGGTRAEMRESATALVALAKSIETKARNAALKEHGITPEPAGTSRTPPKSYGDMTDEEFEKEIAKGRGGGASLW